MRLLCLLSAILVAPFVTAQTNERLYEDLNFRFVTPGARAIAMGKSFVGLADDATAAYSNPAGLSNLLEQEVSFEMNTNQIKHHRNIPVTRSTTRTLTFGDRVATPSFFSYAAPVGNLTFSTFRNVVQDYEESFSFRGRCIPGTDKCENGAFGDIDITAVNYGFGLSYLVNPRISVGGSFVMSHIDVDTHGGTGSSAHPRNTTVTTDSDFAPSGIVGVLVKPLSSLSVGFVYATKSKFTLDTTLDGEFVLQPGDLVNLHGVQREINYVIPERYSAGISWKPKDRLTFSLDASRIRYSQQVTDKFLVLDFIKQLSPDNYFIEDATEVHAGAELRFYSRSAVWAARAGVFTDPRHPLRFQKLAGTPDFAAAVENFRFNTSESRTDVGGTFGLGLALQNHVQIDSAFSFSRNSEEIVLSFVWKL